MIDSFLLSLEGKSFFRGEPHRKLADIGCFKQAPHPRLGVHWGLDPKLTTLGGGVSVEASRSFRFNHDSSFALFLRFRQVNKDGQQEFISCVLLSALD